MKFFCNYNIWIVIFIIRCNINISGLYLMLVLYMNMSPLTEYRMNDIDVVLRIYEWVLFYAAVLHEWGRLKDFENASLTTVHNFTLRQKS